MLLKRKSNNFIINTEPLKVHDEVSKTTDFKLFQNHIQQKIANLNEEIENKIKQLLTLKLGYIVNIRVKTKYLQIRKLFKIISKDISNINSVPPIFYENIDGIIWYLTYKVDRILTEQSNDIKTFINNFLDHQDINSKEKEYDLELTLETVNDFISKKEKDLDDYLVNLIDVIIISYEKEKFKKINKKLEKIQKQKSQDIKNFFDSYKKSSSQKKLCDSKLYLKDFLRQYENLKSKYETAFRQINVKKVDILNQPKQKTKKDKRTKTFPFVESDYIIDLENVSKYYSNGVTTNRVLNSINLKLKSGDFIVILGPSGSGKTTLLNIISGMDRATLGRTIVANANLMNLNNTQLTEFRRLNVGYIFQQYGLLPNLNVKENIEIGSYLQHDSKKRLDIDKLLKETGMYEYKNRLPSELSGGQQQRVSILRAIAKNPKIIFGDEPTGALDEEMTQIVLDQFVKVNREYKTTIIIVTHNPLIAELATCVIRVHDGKIKNITYNPNPKQVSEINWSQN